MCISTKILDMYLMFISAHMVLKEIFGVETIQKLYKINVLQENTHE